MLARLGHHHRVSRAPFRRVAPLGKNSVLHRPNCALSWRMQALASPTLPAWRRPRRRSRYPRRYPRPPPGCHPQTGPRSHGNGLEGNEVEEVEGSPVSSSPRSTFGATQALLARGRWCELMRACAAKRRLVSAKIGKIGGTQLAPTQPPLSPRGRRGPWFLGISPKPSSVASRYWNHPPNLVNLSLNDSGWRHLSAGARS
jgi:hypothetical protein